MKISISTWVTLFALLFFVPSSYSEQDPAPAQDEEEESKRDDWVLDLSFPGAMTGVSKAKTSGAASATLSSPGYSRAALQSARSMPSKKLGFAVGGAADINTFRDNIDNKFLPLASSITVEGLYNDYFFDTGVPAEPSKTLFSPTYTFANSADPISGKEEYYMAVGLHSDMDASQFTRKKLNLVVVLDISGSMSSPFTQYHYDKKRGPIAAVKRNIEKNKSDQRSKMEIACEAVQSLTQQLRDDDRFGMVVFDNQGYLAKPLNLVGETDMDKIRGHIGKLKPRGGTNFEAGYKKGTELYNELKNVNPEEYENRIIFLTDAMPNRGQIKEEGLFGITEKNARNRIYSTFVGVGVDFNTDLVEAITKSKGANYYSVRSSEEFNKLLKEDFEYMVTPMVFDLSLQFKAKGLSIERVYGSPEADLATGELLKVNTLFPSRVEEDAVKGGLVLLKLNGDPKGAEISLKASYEKRDGTREFGEQKVSWQGKGFDNNGIRKGVLLARYANLLANWCLEERALAKESSGEEYTGGEKPELRFCSLHQMDRIGIRPMPIIQPERELNKWERTSIPLQVNPKSAATLKTFIKHFRDETKALGDEELKQEIDILKKLVSLSDKKQSKTNKQVEEKNNDTDEPEPSKKDDWQLKR